MFFGDFCGFLVVLGGMGVGGVAVGYPPRPPSILWGVWGVWGGLGGFWGFWGGLEKGKNTNSA